MQTYPAIINVKSIPLRVALVSVKPVTDDGPTLEVWSVHHIEKYGMVYASGDKWIASGNIEFPTPLDTYEDAVFVVAAFRGQFPTGE